MMFTRLLYLEDFSLLNCTAQIVELYSEQDKQVIVLDQTVFYPQGGGQPYDTGIIINDAGEFIVEQVRFVEGIVKHIGTYVRGNFTVHTVVNCWVDQKRRQLHTRLHSAGHVIDMAIAALNLPWIPGKGFHFPEGPYVEYSGILDEIDKENIKNNIEAQANAFIQSGIRTSIALVKKEEMGALCRFVPENLPENKPSRVVLYGSFGVPCGGTHVANLSEIGAITIRKIKMEKGNIRVSYAIIQ
jgi:Ser-tRNA(Ala) deacylase AlaX